MSKIRFYLDENVQVEVAPQLVQHGIEAVSVKTLEKLGDSDTNHLQRAIAMGYVLCTYDQDFLRLAAEGADHAGIVFGEQYQATIGGWVRKLCQLHSETSAEEMIGQVRFVSLK
ncbi:MAG: DUF5615 family PIN-like protein [Chloroflexota bacterium]